MIHLFYSTLCRGFGMAEATRGADRKGKSKSGDKDRSTMTESLGNGLWDEEACDWSWSSGPQGASNPSEFPE